MTKVMVGSDSITFSSKSDFFRVGISVLANVQDEPRPCLARPVLLGAQGVTDRVVGSGDWFGSVVFI